MMDLLKMNSDREQIDLAGSKRAAKMLACIRWYHMSSCHNAKRTK